MSSGTADCRVTAHHVLRSKWSKFRYLHSSWLTQAVAALVLAVFRARPVLVGRGWEERCTDDWEGPVPTCEWVGRQWPYPGFAEFWPPPGHRTNWHGWHPPF